MSGSGDALYRQNKIDCAPQPGARAIFAQIAPPRPVR